MKKKLLLLLPAALTIGVAYFYFRLYPQLPIADGYAARKMCSCTFIAGRSQESIQETDLGFGPLSMTRTRIDRDSGSAVTTLFGMAPRTAVYRGDVGCILLSGKDDNGISLSIDRPVLPDTLLWPRGTSLAYPAPPQGVDMEKLNAAVRNAFDPGMAMSSKKTRAVVVVHEGRLAWRIPAFSRAGRTTESAFPSRICSVCKAASPLRKTTDRSPTLPECSSPRRTSRPSPAASPW